MIPILYEATATDFSTFGIGALADCISCEVTEERNGSFECKLKYPTNGVLYEEIKNECIIKAKPNETKQPQAFRIYRITVPINGVVAIYAQHISYDLANVGVTPFSLSDTSPSQAIEQVLNNTVIPHNFTFQTDYSQGKDFSVEKPKSVRACLGGTEGSLMNLWGGEFEWDNFKIIHHQGRGNDNGVTIEYGKNLTLLEHDADISDVYSDLLPYAVNSKDDEDEVITLPELTLPISTVLKTRRSVIKDFTDSFEDGDVITADVLREKAQEYLKNNPLGVESPSIKISFEPLWKQPEYAAILERVALCDTVTVKHTALGIKTRTKVIKTVYDTLAEKYNSITLGSSKANLADTVQSITEEVQNTKKEVNRFPAFLKAAINSASKLITGQSGGYVVFHGSETGKPYELLILDAENIEDAVNVWRWNAGGLGFSKNGYNGPYETAITADGSIVANFITSGSLVANIIKAGVFSSLDGSSYWNLETGEVVIKAYAKTEAVEKVQTAADKAQSTAENAQAAANVVQNAVEDLAADVSDLNYDLGVVSGNVGTLTTNVKTLTTKQATLETNLDGLTSTVSAVTTRVTTAEGKLVSVESTVTALQQTATEISAEVSKKVDETYGSSSSTFGWVLKSTGFYVYSSAKTVMSITSSGLSVVGAIDATSGSIGNLTIDGYLYFGGNSAYYISANYNDSNYYINLPGLRIDKASTAVFTGKLSAPSGTIGGFTIASDKLYKTKTSYSDSNSGVYIGTDGIGLGSGTFYVTSAGKLYATNAELRGTLYLSGSDNYGFYNTSGSFSYSTTIGGSGISSVVNVYPSDGGSQVANSYIGPCGTIIVPQSYYFDVGTVFGVANSRAFKHENLIVGITTSHQYDTYGKTTTVLNFRVANEDIFYAIYNSAMGKIISMGCEGWDMKMKGNWYPGDNNSGYLGYYYFNYSYGDAGGLFGKWILTGKMHCGTNTTSYLSNVTVGSNNYPYLYGTWYANTLYFGTSTSSYQLRIDSDQVTWYYGNKQIGEIEGYSSYVDVQGTFRLNGSSWISSSDIKVKNNIECYSDAYDALFDNLIPRKYKYNNGTSDRYHTGFVVQEVLQAMQEANLSTMEFAAVCAFGDPDNPETEWGLRYEEMIPLNTWQIQKLKKRVEELEKIIKFMEDKQ